MLDPALIGSVMPRELDYMAKTELFGIPGFGALIRRLNAHPVDRTGSDSQRCDSRSGCSATAVPCLSFQRAREVSGRLQPARPGAGMLAALSGAPVVPVYIQGSGRALARGTVSHGRSG